jgi:hypothetical protein
LKFDVGDNSVGIGQRLAIFAKAFQMQLDCFPDVAFDFLSRSPCRDAAGEIRDISGKIIFAMLDTNRVLFVFIIFSW